MKVFVLTHSSSRKNWLPVVSESKEVVEKALKEKLKELLEDCDYDPEYDPEPTEFYEGVPVNSAVDSYDYGNDWAEIIYYDDNYDELEIYEIEIK